MAAGGQAGAGSRDLGRQGRGHVVQPLQTPRQRRATAFARQGKENCRERVLAYGCKLAPQSLQTEGTRLKRASGLCMRFTKLPSQLLISPSSPKASVRAREVKKSVEELMERLNMSLTDVVADCGILRCVAKKRPVLEVTDRHGV